MIKPRALSGCLFTQPESILRRYTFSGLLLTASTLLPPCPAVAQDITELGLEELLNTEVTSVSKTGQKLSDAAAAVFVISQEDLRRSGVTSIPEALRMVPGLHVARLNANQWAVTARGFNGQFANKLLVLVDGRTVYTPIFSGVYWEALDLPLADIERIEVIRGPGASLWGANAVNGIINIITKQAQDTQGAYISLAVGDEEQTLATVRYGGHKDEQLHWRVFGKWSQRDGLLDMQGEDARDDWTLASGGFRLDWLPAPGDVVLLQGSLHRADLQRNYTLPSLNSASGNETVLDDGALTTQSLSARWEHTDSPASRSALQFYYQRERRNDISADYTLETLDLDFQQEFAISQQQEIIWGLGFRYSQDDFNQSEIINLQPRQRDYQLFSLFAQDRLSLFDDRVELTLGSKFEHNSFSGWEIQPSLRALWRPGSTQRLWASVARAVRSPSRAEDDTQINSFLLPASAAMPPSLFTVNGDRAFESETLIAYEIGYRIWPRDDLFLDIAAFYNDYDDLRFASVDLAAAQVDDTVLTIPITLNNAERGALYGFEIAADWRPYEKWHLQLAYSYLQADFEFKPGFDTTTLVPAGLSDDRNPQHQVSVRAGFQLAPAVELDVWLRYVDSISAVQALGAAPTPSLSIDDYVSLDLRLGWQPAPGLELSLHGRNLSDTPYIEFLPESNGFPVQVERSIYGQLTWRF
ncbi:MAG: TonB-dependent receptor [Candidatus Competibacteraceae bacterium]|nr:TonB-dependent receptor [Candidatus Competibacteraceae bacterium]